MLSPTGLYKDITKTVVGTIVRMPAPLANADCYLEVSFNSTAGIFEKGSTIEIKNRIAKTDWTNYNQSNDYSFNPSATNYVDWNKIAVYYKGTLIYGTEPK